MEIPDKYLFLSIRYRILNSAIQMVPILTFLIILDLKTIFMHGLGISDISLTYGATSHNGISGIGIYANGTLEALVTGNFNTAQIDSMTTGGFFA